MTSPSKVAPAHYSYKISPLEAIQEWGLGFCLGNTVKYIARCGKKDGETRLDDLEKVMFYLAKEIEHERSLAVGDIEVAMTGAIETKYGRYKIYVYQMNEFDNDLAVTPAGGFQEKWKTYRVG